MQAQEAWRYRNSEDQSCDVSRLSVGVTALKGAAILALLRGTNRMLYSEIGNHVHALSMIEYDFCKSVRCSFAVDESYTK